MAVVPPDANEDSGIRPVSLRPHPNRTLRDAARLLAMVHELHKAGYQRIRISPAMAPSGVHWRCTISYAGNVGDDGYGFRDGSDGHVARYTSGQGARYFDWPAADRQTARQLAARFLDAFPVIAAQGAGLDWPYAGWLTDLLGYAEHGRFVAFFADYPLDPEQLRRWRPPAPPATAREPQG